MPRTTRAWLERIADVRTAGRAGALDLVRALEVLRTDYNVRTAVCEGGPSLLRGLLARGLLDRIFVTFAPLVFGGAKAPTLLGPAAGSLLGRSVQLRLEEFESAGGEGYATYRVLKSR
jgi:riboflavin biosynthesis pyrimidine reductase